MMREREENSGEREREVVERGERVERERVGRRESGRERGQGGQQPPFLMHRGLEAPWPGVAAGRRRSAGGAPELGWPVATPGERQGGGSSPSLQQGHGQGLLPWPGQALAAAARPEGGGGGHAGPQWPAQARGGRRPPQGEEGEGKKGKKRKKRKKKKRKKRKEKERKKKKKRGEEGEFAGVGGARRRGGGRGRILREEERERGGRN